MIKSNLKQIYISDAGFFKAEYYNLTLVSRLKLFSPEVVSNL